MNPDATELRAKLERVLTALEEVEDYLRNRELTYGRAEHQLDQFGAPLLAPVLTAQAAALAALVNLPPSET